MHRVLILGFFILLQLACSNPSIPVITKGKAHLGLAAIEPLQDVADSLNVYLQKATSIRLEKVALDAQGPKIRFELVEQPTDFIQISWQGQDLVFQANSKEMAFGGLYAFLEQQLGVRWYDPETMHIPLRSTFALPKGEVLSHRPKVTTRTVHARLFYEHPEFAQKLRVTDVAFPDYIPEARVHTFHKFMPHEKYYAEHPEYFALRNGQRLPTQLCLTNSNVLSIVKDSVQALFDRYPSYKVISVSQDDNTQYCQCYACEKIHQETGSPAGSMIAFVNAVAADFPDKTISTLAYQYTRKPSSLQPAENVLITLCSIECDRSVPIAEGCLAFAKDLEGWSALTSNIRIWDYTTQFTNFLAPFPNWQTLQPNIDLFVKNNARWIFEQHSNQPSELFALRAYLTAQLLWDPEQDFNALLADFTSGYYGAAGPYILTYINRISEAMAEAQPFFLFLYGDPSQGFDSFLAAEKLREYNRLFDAAAAAVAGQSQLENRVAEARLSIDYALLEAYRKGLDGFAMKSSEKEINPQVFDLLTRFETVTQEEGITAMNETRFTVAEYLASYRMMLDRVLTPNRAVGKHVTLNTSPKKYADENPQVLTDGAFGGSSFFSNWLGFEGNHLEAVVDLGEVQSLEHIEMAFLQVTNHIVFFPTEVQYSISVDGQNWIDLPAVQSQSPLNPNSQINDHQIFALSQFQANGRYIKIRAQNLQKAPYWHHAAGLPSWIFADELVVR